MVAGTNMNHLERWACWPDHVYMALSPFRFWSTAIQNGLQTVKIPLVISVDRQRRPHKARAIALRTKSWYHLANLFSSTKPTEPLYHRNGPNYGRHIDVLKLYTWNKTNVDGFVGK